jgi:hypothetical protein
LLFYKNFNLRLNVAALPEFLMYGYISQQSMFVENCDSKGKVLPRHEDAWAHILNVDTGWISQPHVLAALSPKKELPVSTG